MSLDLSVIVPVLNERDNVGLIVERLENCLGRSAWECIFVDDDSPDGTADAIRALARSRGNVRLIQRIGRRGLASACSEGILSSHADYAAVLDGDLQHDETLLPMMLDKIRSEDLDLVVGTRYAAEGENAVMTPWRRLVSLFGTHLSSTLFRLDISDPMSGFFMIRTDRFRALAGRLSNIGFKILLDIVLSSPKPLKSAELAYRFRERHSGASKLDTRIVLEFVGLLVDKALGGWIPLRFLGFLAVGATGVVVHLAVVSVLYLLARLPFGLAQGLATYVAMTSNFLLNNQFTYRDRRLKGWAWVRGFVTFVAVCSIGALFNVQISTWMFSHEWSWNLSALAGISISAVWNYAATNVLTWPKRRRAS